MFGAIGKLRKCKLNKNNRAAKCTYMYVMSSKKEFCVQMSGFLLLRLYSVSEEEEEEEEEEERVEEEERENDR